MPTPCTFQIKLVIEARSLIQASAIEEAVDSVQGDHSRTPIQDDNRPGNGDANIIQMILLSQMMISHEMFHHQLG